MIARVRRAAGPRFRRLPFPRRARLLGPAAVALLSLAAAVPNASRAAVINVTTTNQEIDTDADCSLQEAIAAANFDSSQAIDPANSGALITTGCTAGSGADTIVLSPGATYQMSGFVQDFPNMVGLTANPIVFTTIVIQGNGAVLERVGGLAIRAFAVAPTISFSVGGVPFSGIGNLYLQDLHIRNFRAQGGNGSEGGGGGLGAGGAVYNRAVLAVDRCTFEGNMASGGAGSSQTTIAGGGGGGGLSSTAIGGNDVAFGAGNAGGGGGGSRGRGGNGSNDGGGGGGTSNNGIDGTGPGGNGGYNCGGVGGTSNGAGAGAGFCAGGGGGGGARNTGNGGAGGAGNYGGGGGGGGASSTANGGPGGAGGFGGGGGSGAVGGGAGGAGGFGGGGGARGDAAGASAVGGAFAGNAVGDSGGGGAGLGSAIFSDDGFTTISNSTFFGNSALGGAGGPGAQAGSGVGVVFGRLGVLTVRNSTISDSTGSADLALAAEFLPAVLNTGNDILANNLGGGTNCQVFALSGGVVGQTGSNNLVESTVGCLGVVSSADPQLGPLQLNVPGNTPTMAILAASPAYNAGDNPSCLATDQRGVVRPQFGTCDIGAYELGTFPTTTALTCAPNPSLFTQLVTCTATVTSPGGTPTGSVSFTIDGGAGPVVPLDGAGQATFSTSSLAVGGHTVDAAYGGSATFDPSVAPTWNQTVLAIPTVTTLSCAPNPSIFTQLVTCTTTVTATFGVLVPTGNVAFSVDGGAPLAVPLNAAGQASFSTSSLAVGNHSIDAAYSGSTNFLPSAAPTWNQVVQQIPTATSLVCAPNPAFYGQQVDCTATVVATFGALTPIGNVSFQVDGGAPIVVPLDGAGQASFSTSSLEVGDHTIDAAFVGSTNFAPSVAPPFVETVAKIPTLTDLVSAPNPVVLPSPVTFTATVTKTEAFDGLPTGAVTFQIDGIDQAPPVPIDAAGVAELVISSNDLGPGDHAIGAHYGGDAHFLESDAPGVVQTVQVTMEIPTLSGAGLLVLALALASLALLGVARRRAKG